MNLFYLLELISILSVCSQYLREDAEKHHLKAGRKNHLYDSSWPADHGDSSRSKYSLNAGLPKSFKPEDLKILKQPILKGAQWLYTQGEGSQYLFLMGGSLLDTYISKVDSQTLNVIEKKLLPTSLYLGGMLMHANGHVYAIHQNVLYAFWHGDLANFTTFRLPTNLNKATVQTNGMLVTQDGYIMIKQWPLVVDDLLFYSAAAPPLIPAFIIILLMAICLTIYITYDKNQSGFQLVLYTILGILLGVSVYLTLIICLISHLVKDNVDPMQFVLQSHVLAKILIRLGFNHKYLGTGGGELKFIDPLTLAVITSTVLPERCSVARMSLVAVRNSDTGENEDAIVLLGDELAFQYRWVPSNKSIYFLPEWTKRYRRWGDGSYQATGAAIYNDIAYFTGISSLILLINNY